MDELDFDPALPRTNGVVYKVVLTGGLFIAIAIYVEDIRRPWITALSLLRSVCWKDYQSLSVENIL